MLLAAMERHFEMIFTALYGRRAFKPNLGSDGYFDGGKEALAHANNAAALRPSFVGILYSNHLLTKHYPHG